MTLLSGFLATAQNKYNVGTFRAYVIPPVVIPILIITTVAIVIVWQSLAG